MATSSNPVGLKLQAKLDGYEAWAFSRLMELEGRKNHDLCRTIIREWFQLKREHLRDQFGVSLDAWDRENGGNVRQMAKGRKGRATEDAR